MSTTPGRYFVLAILWGSGITLLPQCADDTLLCCRDEDLDEQLVEIEGQGAVASCFEYAATITDKLTGRCGVSVQDAQGVVEGKIGGKDCSGVKGVRDSVGLHKTCIPWVKEASCTDDFKRGDRYKGECIYQIVR